MAKFKYVVSVGYRSYAFNKSEDAVTFVSMLENATVVDGDYSSPTKYTILDNQSVDITIKVCSTEQFITQAQRDELNAKQEAERLAKEAEKNGEKVS